MSQILDLKASSSVDVFFETASTTMKIPCQYVGCSKGAFLILRYPQKMTTPGWQDALAGGRVLTIRALSNREALEVISFQASILRNIRAPERLILLQFPTEIESRKLRSEPRLSIEIMATLTIDDQAVGEQWGLVRDISLSGCACEFNLTDDIAGDDEAETQIKLETLKEVAIKLSVNMEMYGDDTVYEINGTIKNAVFREKVILGVKFEETDSENAQAFFNRLVIEGIHS